ncbi:ABC1K1, partial [Symbiodinium sp. CCMP2456]
MLSNARVGSRASSSRDFEGQRSAKKPSAQLFAKPSWQKGRPASTFALFVARVCPVFSSLLWRRWRPGNCLQAARLRAMAVRCQESEPGPNGILPSKCERCNRKLCLCAALPQRRLDTKTRVVLFTHPKEKRRALGSGPLLQLCLSNITEFVGKEFPDPLEDSALHDKLVEAGRQPVLVYPGPKAVELVPGCQTEAFTSPVTLIFIDARWDQARIMLNRSAWLQGLPRLRLRRLRSRYRFRRQPEPGCLSTLEAAAEALQALEPGTSGLREALLAPFEEMIRLQSQFLPDQQDKNPIGGLFLEGEGLEAAKENAHPSWNRRRKRRHRRRMMNAGHSQGEDPSAALTSQASSTFGFWMPDHASPTCVLCGRAWMPIIRQRHHCRACGSLVCGQCSFCPNGRSSRRCLPPAQTAPCAAPSRAGSKDSSAHPCAALGTCAAPLLSKLFEPCPDGSASQPSEREQRLWERVVAAEKRTLEAEAEGGGEVKLVSHIESKTSQTRAWEAARFRPVPSFRDSARVAKSGGEKTRLQQYALSLGGERFSAYGEHFFIFVVATAVVLLLTIFRPASLLVSAVTLSGVVWLLVRTFSLEVPDSPSLSGDWRALAFPVAVLHLPGWSTTCFLLGISVLVVRRLQSYHYFLRLAEIYVTAAFPIAFYFTCKTVQKVFKLSAQQAQDWMYDPADKIVAPFLGNRFAALGGLFVKAGQWMANMAATPIVWQQELKKLQDCAPRDTDAYVKSLLEAELGSDFQDIFEEFDFEPVASASIAQVHKARMKGTGQQVAVKLQHEGVEPMMLLDLTALKRILRFTCWLGGNDWDEIKQVTEGWMKEMIHELDFHREVENLQEVRKGMADAGVDVIVPKEIEGRVSRRAFIMDFCEGFRFTDLDQLALAGVDRKALSARAVHAVATQLLEIGVFNSDPHGGNLLCQVRDGTTAVPVLLDFGNCIRLPEEQRLLYCRLLVALSETSMTSVCEAMKNLGFFNSQTEVHPGRDMEYMMMVFRDTGNRKHQMAGMKNFRELRKSQNKSDIEALDDNIKKDKKKAKAADSNKSQDAKTERYPKKMPPEAVLFLRMMLLVRGLCFQLDAELPFLQLFEMHARRALACRFPKVHRALSAVSSGDDRGRSRAGAAHMAMITLIREAIAACCVERPGLGVQVCVYIGENCAVDECGGVLGTVDPRPMTRSTRIPLADLARLPWLLALHSAVKQGMIQYSERLMSMPMGSRCNTEATLADVLSHRAFQDGDPRDALTGSTVTELAKLQHMQKRTAAAIAPVAGQVCYLPWGSGYVAAAALRQLGHDDE